MENIEDLQGIDLTRIQKDYKDKPALYHLQSGENVVGHMVDSDNRLIYIIRDDDKIRCNYAQDEVPDYSIPEVKGHSVTVKA